MKMKNVKCIRFALMIVLVLLLGWFAECLFRFPALSAASANGSGAVIDLSRVTWDDGFRMEDGKLVLAGESGTILVPLDGSYISDFVYSYRYDGLLNADVKIGVKNIYGETREKEVERVSDRNMSVLGESHIPVGGRADYAEITVTRDGLDEAGLSHMNFRKMPLEFTAFRTEINTGVNPYRLLFCWGVLFLIGMAVLSGWLPRLRIEAGFFLIAIVLGTLLSVSLPANKIGWDEEVHFRQAFWLANYKQPVDVTEPVMDQFITGMATWPYNQPGSRDEQNMLETYLDQNALLAGGPHHWSTDLNWTTVTGYLGEGLFLRIGQILKFPFSALFRLGRLGNLLIYAMVMALAIRITPVGKPILAFLGLMPEPLFLAGVYSYDPTVTAFLCLSFALILRVWMDENEKMTWIRYGAILLNFVWGCRIKAVYAPLLLIGLLIPGDRYRSKRERNIMRAGFVLATVLLMASFVLPVVFAPRDIGDTRGVMTSEKGQMAYVLGQPAAYAAVLISNMLRTLPSYVLGEEAFGRLGHPLSVSFPWVFYAAAVFMILTGNREDDGDSHAVRFRLRDRLVIFLIIAGTAVLVWTSMYIAFTTPGNTYIDGVQGRYYLPLLFPLWLILVPPFVRIRLKERTQHVLALLIAGGILALTWVMDVYPAFCR